MGAKIRGFCRGEGFVPLNSQNWGNISLIWVPGVGVVSMLGFWYDCHLCAAIQSVAIRWIRGGLRAQSGFFLRGTLAQVRGDKFVARPNY